MAHLSSSPLSPGPKGVATAGGSALAEKPSGARGTAGQASSGTQLAGQASGGTQLAGQASGGTPSASSGAGAGDDLLLVRRLVTGDAAAWRMLVSGYQRLVLARVIATARELNQALGSSDAEDLCADVFSQLVRDEFAALKRFEGRSTLATWLCVVTRRIVLRRLVVARREPSQPTAQPPVLEALPGPTSEEPLSVIISEEDQKLLAKEIARLSERHQELARLFYIEGKSYREISQQLGISMNSIGPTLGRIHEKLRAAMGGGS